MKRLAAAVAVTVALTATPALATEPCMPTAWGECLTAADYDERFGYDNLSTIEVHVLPGMTVAEVYDIDPDIAASERPRDFMGEPLPTFAVVLTDTTWSRIDHNGWVIE